MYVCMPTLHPKSLRLYVFRCRSQSICRVLHISAGYCFLFHRAAAAVPRCWRIPAFQAPMLPGRRAVTTSATPPAPGSAWQAAVAYNLPALPAAPPWCIIIMPTADSAGARLLYTTLTLPA